MSNSVAWSKESQTISRIIFEIQQEVPFIGKDSTNPHFKSKYASLEDIWSTLRPIFFKHGILVSQVPGVIKDGAIEVITQIIHVASGEFVLAAGYMPMGKEGPQAAGSAITYARRYFLCPMLGIVAGEDDDAETAEGRSAVELAKLRKRKEMVLSRIRTAELGDSMPLWVSKVLKRAVDDKITLNNEAEITMLEVAINEVSIGKKA
jgi:hypothetical protein